MPVNNHHHPERAAEARIQGSAAYRPAAFGAASRPILPTPISSGSLAH